MATSERDELYVDHCHTSHLIRTLSCNWCNLVLGHMYDNITLSRTLTGYLVYWKTILLPTLLPEEEFRKPLEGKYGISEAIHQELTEVRQEKAEVRQENAKLHEEIKNLQMQLASSSLERIVSENEQN